MGCPGCLLPFQVGVLFPISKAHHALVLTARIASLTVRNLLVAVAANELWHLNLYHQHSVSLARGCDIQGFVETILNNRTVTIPGHLEQVNVAKCHHSYDHY